MKFYLSWLILFSCLYGTSSSDQDTQIEIQKWLKTKTSIFYTNPNTSRTIPSGNGGGIIKYGIPFIDETDDNSSIWKIELGMSQRTGKEYFVCDGEYLSLLLDVKTWKIKNIDRNFTCKNPQKMKLDSFHHLAEKTKDETQKEKDDLNSCLLKILNNDGNMFIESCGIAPTPQMFVSYYFLKDKNLKTWMNKKTNLFNRISGYRVNFSANGALLWELRYNNLINQISANKKDVHLNAIIYLHQDTMRLHKVDINILNDNIFPNEKSLEDYQRKTTSCISNSIIDSKIEDVLSECGLRTKEGKKGTLIYFE